MKGIWTPTYIGSTTYGAYRYGKGTFEVRDGMVTMTARLLWSPPRRPPSRRARRRRGRLTPRQRR